MRRNRKLTDPAENDVIEALRRRLGRLDPHQIMTWRAMSPARRLELAFQAYQFALDVVRLTERQRHPDLSPDDLAWRVTRRMQGNLRLGRLEYDEAGRSATFITPEDIIVAKLIAHREIESDKHLRDARGVLMMQWGELDLEAIRRSARANGILEQFEALLEAVHRELEE
jgi:hypothetical protein